MITRFGIFCRKLRLEKGQILRDMAKLLKVSSAYLSAVEIGKRPVPQEWCDKIAIHYSLSPADLRELKDAALQSISQVKINLDKANNEQKEAAFMFARKLDKLDKKDLQKIFNVISKKKG